MKHQSFDLFLYIPTPCHCLSPSLPSSLFILSLLLLLFHLFPPLSFSALLFSGFTSVIFAHSHNCFSTAYACVGVSSLQKGFFAGLQIFRVWNKILCSCFFLRLTWQPACHLFFFLYRPFELIASGSLVLLLFFEQTPDVCVCQIELLLALLGALFNCLMAIIVGAHNQHYSFLHRYVSLYYSSTHWHRTRLRYFTIETVFLSNAKCMYVEYLMSVIWIRAQLEKK